MPPQRPIRQMGFAAVVREVVARAGGCPAWAAWSPPRCVQAPGHGQERTTVPESQSAVDDYAHIAGRRYVTWWRAADDGCRNGGAHRWELDGERAPAPTGSTSSSAITSSADASWMVIQMCSTK